MLVLSHSISRQGRPGSAVLEAWSTRSDSREPGYWPLPNNLNKAAH